MNKTIAAIAISASTSSFALVGPVQESKTVCLRASIDQNRLIYSGTCDESVNNVLLNRPVLENKCAKGQIAMQSIKVADAWYPEISFCMRPNVVQL